MKRKPLFLLILALMFYVPLIFAQVGEQNDPRKPATPETQHVSEIQMPREVIYPESRLLDGLRNLLTLVGITVEESQLENAKRLKSSYNVLIEWDARPGAPKFVEPDYDTLLNGIMIIKERRKYSVAPPQLPVLTLTPDRIFLAAIDAQARLRWWYVKENPLIFRGEYTDPATGQKQGETLHWSKTAFTAAYPDDQKITELRFFIPKWTGNAYILQPIATLPVAALPLL